MDKRARNTQCATRLPSPQTTYGISLIGEQLGLGKVRVKVNGQNWQENRITLTLSAIVSHKTVKLARQGGFDGNFRDLVVSQFAAPKSIARTAFLFGIEALTP